MFFELALIFSALFMVIYIGGQIDLSTTEKDAEKYWSQRYKSGGGDKVSLSPMDKGASGPRNGLAAPSLP